MLTGVAQVLVATATLETAVVEKVYRQSLATQTPFVVNLIAGKFIDANRLANILHQSLNLPLLDLTALDQTKLATDLLTAKFCCVNRLLPLSLKNKTLFIATDDPCERSAFAHIRFSRNVELQIIVVNSLALDQLLLKCFAIADKNKYLVEELSNSRTAAVAKRIEQREQAVDLLDEYLRKAVQMGASDLHFEPYENIYRLRFRLDGKLITIAQLEHNLKEVITSRIKIIANLDIAEKRLPQDGRVKLGINGRNIDCRISTLPTIYGEKIVIRILDSFNSQLNLDALGYEADDKQLLLQNIKRPYGMILVTGPTGSGKTLSLYSCLNLINSTELNIASIENPTEINLPGINQVNVNEKAGLTFAVALRAFLRQDPDVIMVGEIRDALTADVAIKAAQTGHLVLSTLHTNDAPSALTRLVNMGIAPFNLVAGIILITAQRLVRRLCNFCKSPEQLSKQSLIDAGFSSEQLTENWPLYKAVGCKNCYNGYRGRIGIYQVMPISESIQHIVLAGGTTLDIAQQAKKEGVRSLREAGLLKVRQGITSLTEVMAVTNN